MQRASSSFREPGVSSACWQQRTYPRSRRPRANSGGRGWRRCAPCRDGILSMTTDPRQPGTIDGRAAWCRCQGLAADCLGGHMRTLTVRGRVLRVAVRHAGQRRAS
jgi:hypothetical protein